MTHSLVSIASRTVIWFISGNQQWNDTNKPELDRREKLYNAAMSELEDYEAPMTNQEERKDVHRNCRSYYDPENPETEFDPNHSRRISDW